MKVAVLGSGNGGLAVAFEWSKAGHEVSIFDFESFPENISNIAEKGGVSADGELDGFQPVAYAGHDISKVVPDANLVFAVGPAYSTEAFGKACEPYAQKGQIFVVCPGSCGGSLVFKKALGLDIADESIVIAETSTLPYAVRLTGKAHITVYNRLKGGFFIAALPSRANNMVFGIVSKVYENMELAENVFQTSLQNANPIIHPSVTLCNAALIERTRGDFLFYEEGVTEAVGRVIEAMDLERIAIGKALGINVIPDPELGIRQGYQAVNNYSTGYSEAPGFKGIKAQSQLDHRYLNEDAGYGLVFFTDLAEKLGVDTPNMDAVLRLSSVVMKRDYKAEKARTLDSMGLGNYSPEELKKLL